MMTFTMTMPSIRHPHIRLLWLVPMFLMLIVVPVASAHTELVRSDPAAGATLTSAPQQVTLVFSALVDSSGSSIAVVDANGTTVSQGAATLSASDQKALVVALQPGLGDGTYMVRWSVMSAEDGHTSSDAFTFTVGAATQTAPGSVTQLPATGTSFPRLPIMYVAIGLLVVGLGVHAVRFLRTV